MLGFIFISIILKEQYFFSHGKLLLTAEYFVLDGAKALAIPTKLGQDFSVKTLEDNLSTIHWKTYREGSLWLEAIIDYRTMSVVKANLVDAANFILKIFKTLKELQSPIFNTNSYELSCNVQFPENFGLGSSSTLMTNVANWAQVDAYELNDKALGGSGYDIAVAKKGHPLFYTRLKDHKIVERIHFNPSFKEDLLFIHLNKKQDSREGISMYRSLPKDNALIQEFSTLTDEVAKVQDLGKFSLLMMQHEELMSNFLKIQTVKEKYFSDAPVFFKSLGAWGGDFILTTKFSDYKSYFRHKGFSNFYQYEDLIY